MTFNFTHLRNEEVIERYINGDAGQNATGTLRIIENALSSYNTIIAMRNEDNFIVLNPEMSETSTTRKHINLLLKQLHTVKPNIIIELANWSKKE